MKNQTKKIIENAINSFYSDYNCAQSVLTVFSEKLKFDKNLASSISCGFGGGMGRLQKTCGAVTGAYMVLGIFNSTKFTDLSERKEKTYSKVQEFQKRFLEKHHSTDCSSLLNCDLKTDEGHQYFEDNNLKKNVCELCIKNSIEIVNEMIDN